MPRMDHRLPRAPGSGWPVHSVCGACGRALSRTQVVCSCGWEQRPPLVHVLGVADFALCAGNPIAADSEIAPSTPRTGREEWGGEEVDGWIPIDRDDEADPLPTCSRCIARLYELEREAANNGELEEFSGRALLRAIAGRETA